MTAFGPGHDPGNCAPGAGDVGTVLACEAENLSKWTFNDRPLKSYPLNIFTARSESISFANATVPNPRDRPSGPTATSARNIVPACLKRSFRSCHWQWKGRFPTNRFLLAVAVNGLDRARSSSGFVGTPGIDCGGRPGKRGTGEWKPAEEAGAGLGPSNSGGILSGLTSRVLVCQL